MDFLKLFIKLGIVVTNSLFSLCGILSIAAADYSSYSGFFQFLYYSLPYLAMTLFSIIMILLVNLKENKRMPLYFINSLLLIIMLETVNNINLLSSFTMPLLTCPVYIIYLWLQRFG